MSRSGFMLLELVLVLFLVGLLAYSTTMSFRVFDTLKVKREFNKLYLLFLSLHYEACVHGEEIEVAFFPQNNTYQVKGRPMYRLPEGVIFGGPQGQKGVTFVNNLLTFRPSYHIESGTVYLRDMHGTLCYRLSATIAQHTYLNRALYRGGKWVDF